MRATSFVHPIWHSRLKVSRFDAHAQVSLRHEGLKIGWRICRWVVLLVCVMLGVTPLEAQQVYSFSTVAGKVGVVGATDGIGANARFNQPAGIVMDAKGNGFVVDRGNHVVRKFSADGTVTTFAGSAGVTGFADGAGAMARFNSPQGITIDGAGNLYVADTGNHLVRKISSSGVVTTLAGMGGVAGAADGLGAAARFTNPQGVAADSSGNVYVADLGNFTIRKITPAGFVSTLAGSPGVAGFPIPSDGTGSSATFMYPTHLTVDGEGNVIVADYLIVRKISAAGVVTTLAGSSAESDSIDGTGSSARFYGLRTVSVDSKKNIVLVDANSLIKVLSPNGVVTSVAGQARVQSPVDGVGGAAQFGDACFLTLDSADHIWLVDAFYHVIRHGSPTVAASRPIITTTPYSQSATLVAGSTARLSVVCSRITPATYRWARDGKDVPNANDSFLNLPDLVADDSGTYTVTASNGSGEASVILGTLSVTPGPVSSFGVRNERIGGSFLWGIAAGRGRLVTVGTGGTVITSDDGVTWTHQDSRTTDWLTGVCFDGEKFVAVGDHGRIIESTDAVNWSSAQDSGTHQRLNNVVYGHGRYVAVGEAGTIMTSEDGQIWTARPTQVSGWLRGLAYLPDPPIGAPHFAACGADAAIVTSDDGITWECAAAVDTNDLEAPVAVESYGSFVAVGESGLIVEGTTRYLSPVSNLGGAVIWTRVYPGLLATQRGLAVGANALFAMSDRGRIFSAPDTHGPWAQIPIDRSVGLAAGVFLDEILYVVGENETILASTPLYLSRLINISTRGQAGNDSDTLISGFVVQGSSAAPVLLRAIGPTLAEAGLNDVLQAPTLKLYDKAGVELAENTRWSTATNAAEIASTMKRVGAFALSDTSADSAILVKLDPGLYTAHVTGARRSTGLALVEAYDASKISNRGARTINVSTRGHVGVGQDRLIAGFVITGESARRVLIRGAGPSLASMGVEGVLAEPELTLYTGRGNVIQVAAAWSSEPSAQEISEAARRAGAFPFAQGSKDAAMIVTLAPATYTVHVTGRNQTTGVALVEVYDLP